MNNALIRHRINLCFNISSAMLFKAHLQTNNGIFRYKMNNYLELSQWKSLLESTITAASTLVKSAHIWWTSLCTNQAYINQTMIMNEKKGTTAKQIILNDRVYIADPDSRSLLDRAENSVFDATELIRTANVDYPFEHAKINKSQKSALGDFGACALGETPTSPTSPIEKILGQKLLSFYCENRILVDAAEVFDVA
jgi:hypothetical protein